MIKSVYAMGYCSISSITVSALLVFSLSVFCPFDTNYIHILFLSDKKMCNLVSIYFLLFWCCSSFFYMFNFVRNRSFFMSKVKHILSGISALTQSIENFKHEHIHKSIMHPPAHDVPTDTEFTNNKETSIRMLKPGSPTATNPQCSCHSTNSSQSLPSLPENNGKIVNAASLGLPASDIVETSPSVGTEPSPNITPKTIAASAGNAICLNPFTDTDTNIATSDTPRNTTSISIVAVEKVHDVHNFKSKSCRSTESENIAKLVLRQIKSDGDSNGNVALCLLPPTSIDDISSEDIEHDYGLNMKKSQNNDHVLPTHIPVLRKPYSNSDPKAQYQYSSITVDTESSGIISNSMLSPKYGTRNAQKRITAKSPKSKKIAGYNTENNAEHDDNDIMNRNINKSSTCYDYTTQNSKPLTPHVLDEKKEFVVPLSVIEDARSLDETVILDSPSSLSKSISIRIHKFNGNGGDYSPHNIVNTQLHHNFSNSTQLSCTSNQFNEVSYTQNSGTCYSTKSARLVRRKELKDIESNTLQQDDRQSVSMQSAPAAMNNRMTITRVESGSKDSDKQHQTKKSRKSKMRRFFRINKKPKTCKCNGKDDNIPVQKPMTKDLKTASQNPQNCKSLPVTPRQVDSSSPSSVQTTDQMLRHSESEKNIQEHHRLNMNNQKMDESVTTQSVSILTMHRGCHAFSAPEEEVFNQYQNAQYKSTALLDMMVSYGWTDQELLSSLQSLRRFSQ